MEQTSFMETPIGRLALTVRDDRLVRLEFVDDTVPERRAGSPVDRRGNRVLSALELYFAGDLDALDVIDVVTAGTAFQRRVWDALRTIPAGEVVSYSELAAEVGRPAAARAVGQANHHNPVAIVVPCHRVVAAGGGLGGYGGGLDRKRWLLAHEGVAYPMELPGLVTASAPRSGRTSR